MPVQPGGGRAPFEIEGFAPPVGKDGQPMGLEFNIVVNQAFADLIWAGGDVLGKRIRLGTPAAAGLEAADRIVSINGSAPDLEQLLRRHGTVVSLCVDRSAVTPLCVSLSLERRGESPRDDERSRRVPQP